MLLERLMVCDESECESWMLVPTSIGDVDDLLLRGSGICDKILLRGLIMFLCEVFS